jgi:hypothetical protein
MSGELANNRSRERDERETKWRTAIYFALGGRGEERRRDKGD